MNLRALCGLAILSAASAQTPRPSDWLSAGGDAHRTNREKTDTQFSKSGVKDFKIVLRHKLGAGEILHAPLVIGRLISYKGFKELAIVAGVSGHVWAIDADLDRIFWERQLPAGNGVCGRVAMPAMMPAAESGPARNASRPIFIVAAEGKLYRLNPATGEDMSPPVDFLPAGSNPADLAVLDNVLYTSTDGACGAPTADWSMDVSTGVIGHSRLLQEPSDGATVLANDVVFTVRGDGTSGNAVLYAADALNGRRIFSSGEQIPSPPSGTGLAIANARVYFTTKDGTLWAFGPPMDRD